MTQLFLRQASVTVAQMNGTIARQIRGLRIDFKIDKTNLSDPNKGTIKIYNLNADSRAAFEQKQSRVLLKVGYGTNPKDLVQIFVGDIRRVAHLKQGPDWITEIEGGDGEIDFTGSQIEKSFPPGTSVKSVIGDVVDQFKNLKNTATNLVGVAGEFVTGFVASGSVAGVLDNLTKKIGSEWSIQDEGVQIVPLGTPTFDTAVLVTPKTGLLGSPAKTLIGYQITTLLNPELKPNRLVAIKSRDVNASFRIQFVSHAGDTYQGQWTSVCELEVPQK